LEEIISLLRCPICFESIENDYYCKRCKRKYIDGEIISLAGNIDDNKQRIKNIYDELGRRKATNPVLRFSTYLNYGIKSAGAKFTRFYASNNLIQSALERIDFNNIRVLDVGCGRGGTLFYIKHNYKPMIIVGLDISQENIKFCRSKNEKINFIVGDAENLPFKEQVFDVLINIESALHYERSLFFREVARVLVRGGLFIYVDIIETNEENYLKRILYNENLEIIEEIDYTKMVIESMKDYLVSIQGKEQLFNHRQMYEDLRKENKQYVMWKLCKNIR